MNLKKENNGRSMIEMLGVLAVIGVLTVGGIAGFSQAMEQFKINKITEVYGNIIFGLLEHKENLREQDGGTGLVSVMRGLDLYPETWTYLNTMRMQDEFGNVLQLYVGENDAVDKQLVFDIYLGGYKSSGWSEFSIKMCEKLLMNLAKPIAPAVYYANVYNSRSSENSEKTWFMGSSFCQNPVNANAMCLSSATPLQIHDACNTCDSTGLCSLTMRFPL